jgi:hypothetical protein
VYNSILFNSILYMCRVKANYIHGAVYIQVIIAWTNIIYSQRQITGKHLRKKYVNTKSKQTIKQTKMTSGNKNMITKNGVTQNIRNMKKHY